MRARPTAAAVAAFAVALACGTGDDERRRSPGEPDVRIWMSTIVRWEDEGPRRVEFAIENPTNRTLAIAAPDPANARVDLYPGAETFRVCGVAPASPPAPGARVSLAPGDRVPVVVDLERACGALPPGEYRFEVSYRAAEPAGEKAVSGALATRYGQVIVTAPVASRAPGAAPRRQGRVEPRRAAEPCAPCAPREAGR